ncbi:PAC2 family protein [Candidatus Pyrohabitans sp.]
MKFMVEKTTIEYIKKPKAKHGRLIQGLLGVGQVGLMAGRQLIDSLGAEKIANIYSVYFLYPNVALPGIVYEDENLVDLHKDEIYYDEKNEIFILTGIYQGTTPESYYNLAHTILKFCEEVGVKEIYTLGGYGTGAKVKEPRTYGVVSEEKTRGILEKAGIPLLEAPKGTLGATGLAGILIPLAEKNGFSSVCLLAETQGMYPDPRASKAAVQALSKLMGIEIPTRELDEQIEAMEKEFEKMEEYARQLAEMYKAPPKGEERLSYIG